LTTVGVVVEQHPDRARLFMQWKALDWPLLWDPFNLLELPAVPITMFLDRERVIRMLQPRLDRASDITARLPDLVGGGPAATGSVPSPVPGRDRMAPPLSSSPVEWSDHAVALALWGGTDRIDEAVVASERSVGPDAEGRLWFRHGVISRMRHDSQAHRSGDFESAIASWTRALAVDPNNYIWRRRLQQYGPRLTKPYAFYDWVPVARSEIESRGETPERLSVEPEGAEFADPAQLEPPPTAPPPPPDPRIALDEVPLVDVDGSMVPASVPPGAVARIHIDIQPSRGTATHWNNEAGPLHAWIDPPHGWDTDDAHVALEVPGSAVSDERRHVEFEVRVPESATHGIHEVEVIMLYAICENDTGVCLVRRREARIPVEVDPAAVAL
jgi:hypothetical protein